MPQLRCTYCGGALLDQGVFYQCDSCRTPIKKSAMERLSEQDVFELNAARLLKESYRFQEAQVAYDAILGRDPECEEAAWGAFLAEYGIEYQVVEQKPTFHALSPEPTYHSRYYARLSAEHRQEADDVIEKKRLEIMRSVEQRPAYDVFLSLKIAEDNGTKTPEYDWATQLYYDLREQGYQVFFSPQVLKQTNADWEPYIYRAIQTCRIMLILTSSIEHTNAPWVRNEWRRILSRIANTPEGEIKPTFRVMATDVNCVPPELMSKQLILRDDLNAMGLISAAIQEACATASDGNKQENAKKTASVEGDRWARGDGEPVDTYLSRIRNVAFTSGQKEKSDIVSALEKERLKAPLNDMDFFILIKRIETSNFDVSRKKRLDEQTTQFLLEHGKANFSFSQNADYLALQNSSLVGFYQKKWHEQERAKAAITADASQSLGGAGVSTPKKKHISPLKIFLLILVVVGIAAGVYAYERHKYYNTTTMESDGRIRIGFDAESLIGEDYESVLSMLTNAGFTKVKVRAVRTLTNKNIDDRYTVKSVTIDGAGMFQKGDKYTPRTSIVISYYDIPENMVVLPFDAKSLQGGQYQNAVDRFTAIGVTDIELIPVTDNLTSRDIDGRVKEVLVDGQKIFSVGQAYPLASKVKIYYYSVPENLIFIPFSSDDFEESNYKDVLSRARAAGFVNIELIPIEDLITGWVTKPGEVESVSIDGNTSFTKGDTYLSDVKFSITYHVKPGEGETLPPYSTETEDATNMIRIDFSSDDLEGDNYKDVLVRLEKAGFTNITAEPLGDLITGWVSDEGEVKSVAINGRTSFSSGESYPKDATIRIVYHSFSR